MSGPPPVRIVLWNDGGEALAAGVDDEEEQHVLRSYADLINESIDDVLRLPQFRHVEVVQLEDAAEGTTGLSIAFDSSFSADGTVDLDKLKGKLDVSGLLLGTSKLPSELAPVAEVVIIDEEQGATQLQITDDALSKQLATALKRARVEERYVAWYGLVESFLGAALDAASATVDATETPLDPYDVVQALVAQLIRVAGVSPPRPNLLSRGLGVVAGAARVPQAALGQVTRRLKRAQRLWWRLEDVAVDGAKLAARVALRAARPVLVGFVLHRVLRSLDASRSLEARMARLPPAEAQALYYRELLGPDWEAQAEEDWAKAMQDVDEGLVTDEINHEKRLMTAAQLRRLEVEEWDKQRMKNFYLSSFGGLRWFDQMEAALHNPLFIESRGWTDPVQNWVGQNRTYPGDLQAGQYMSDVGSLAISLKEAELGRSLSDAERRAVLLRGAAMAGGLAAGVAGKDSTAAAALAAGGALVPRASR